jgi:hypothetical protein
MKKLFYLISLLIPLFSISQINISYETTYTVTNNASNPGYGYLKAFNTHGGLYYYTRNSSAPGIIIYDQNHNFYKSVNINQDYICFITDKLFNDDELIEFLIYGGTGLQLINEDGEILYTWPNRIDPALFRDNDGNYKLVVYNQQTSPPFTAYSDVYALGGTLSVKQQDTYLENSVIGFPNPAGDKITITNRKLLPTDTLLEIFTENGQKISERHLSSSEVEVVVNISSLSTGIYVYKINGETHKFIKK